MARQWRFLIFTFEVLMNIHTLLFCVFHTEYDSSLDIEHTGYEQSVLTAFREFSLA